MLIITCRYSHMYVLITAHIGRPTAESSGIIQVPPFPKPEVHMTGVGAQRRKDNMYTQCVVTVVFIIASPLSAYPITNIAIVTSAYLDSADVGVQTVAPFVVCLNDKGLDVGLRLVVNDKGCLGKGDFVMG